MEKFEKQFDGLKEEFVAKINGILEREEGRIKDLDKQIAEYKRLQGELVAQKQDHEAKLIAKLKELDGRKQEADTVLKSLNASIFEYDGLKKKEQQLIDSAQKEKLETKSHHEVANLTVEKARQDVLKNETKKKELEDYAETLNKKNEEIVKKEQALVSKEKTLANLETKLNAMQEKQGQLETELILKEKNINIELKRLEARKK